MATYVNPQFRAQMQQDPRYAIAQSLLSNASAPQSGAAGGLGALAQVLAGAAGGYSVNKLNDEYKNRQQSAADTLSAALGQYNGQDASTQAYGDGTTIDWDAQQPNPKLAISTLASNPDTADVATNLQLEQIKAKNSLAQKLAEQEYENNRPLTSKERMEFNYRDRELTTDAFGNTIPKYAPDGQTGATYAAPSAMPSSGMTGADVSINGLDPAIANSPYARKKIADAAIEKATASPTEGQANAALYADRMIEADNIINGLGNSGYSPTLGQDFVADLPGGNLVVGDDTQSYQQAQRNFINATLRRESGAAIGKDEFTNARKQYFPQPGDGPDTIAQKAANRSSAIQGIYNASGPAKKNIERARMPTSGSVVDGYKFKGGDPSQQSNWEKIK